MHWGQAPLSAHLINVIHNHMKNEFPENMADHPDEELRLENDLLKLKMQAEFGARFGTFTGEALPPEIEKQFLEQVMAFHKNLEAHPPILLREYLGNPVFQLSSELSEPDLEREWDRINALYHEKQLRVDFLAEYPLALRYDFLAGELMEEEIDPPMMKDQYLCFIYEEAHPNHDYDQRERTRDFMEGFFTGTFHEHDISPELITDSNTTVSMEGAQELLDRFHGMFDSIKNWDYRIKETSAQSDEEMGERMPRLGFTEGLVRYTAVSHDGTEQEIVGPFKLYMECVWGWWRVMHFYMHGFTWGSGEGAPQPEG
jgi:hypothetical protein